jgi:hypothetical protein
MMMRIMTKMTIMKRTNKRVEAGGLEIQQLDIKTKEMKEAAVGIRAAGTMMTKTTMSMKIMMMTTTMKMITGDAAVGTVSQVVVHAEALVE